MHLEAHGAQTATAPSSRRLLPAEIKNTHSFGAIAADARRVPGSFRPEIRIVDRMLKYPNGGLEMIVLTWTPGRYGGGTDEGRCAPSRYPEDEQCLHLRASINHQYILRAVDHAVWHCILRKACIQCQFFDGGIERYFYLLTILRCKLVGHDLCDAGRCSTQRNADRDGHCYDGAANEIYYCAHTNTRRRCPLLLMLTL